MEQLPGIGSKKDQACWAITCLRNRNLTVKKHPTLPTRIRKTIYNEGKQSFKICLPGDAEFRKEMGRYFKAEKLGL